MHDVRLIHVALITKSRYSTQCEYLCPILFAAYVVHYFRVNKPLKIRERDSVILMSEKLLITFNDIGLIGMLFIIINFYAIAEYS